ncbi:hypothetical protein NQZ68_008824 [Dissostichus eleginoides]|nr:hypothetical protein NQZ68_008824 [Dissostichus eleginoides]
MDQEVEWGGGASPGWGVLVMVCCVSSGSCDTSNVGVIYRPLDKQASLPQPVNVGRTDRSQSGVWGPSGALKRLPGHPSEEITDAVRMSDQRSLLSSSLRTITLQPNFLTGPMLGS